MGLAQGGGGGGGGGGVLENPADYLALLGEISRKPAESKLDLGSWSSRCMCVNGSSGSPKRAGLWAFHMLRASDRMSRQTCPGQDDFISAVMTPEMALCDMRTRS